ncbi:MAG: MaoC family dehydratase [Acetobacteraceae bacterium]|nr:MaoC family dehydratase [Acetobacteraceae bacterium]
MLEVETVEALKAHIGKTLGSSDWLTVDQKMIDQFAEATGDHQWIHIDVERAKREMPGGKTIAHGYLTLSLLPKLNQGIFRITKRKRGVNYGSNKVRFTAPVPAGARVRGHLKLKGIEALGNGCSRLTMEASVEVEGNERPALVAETLSLVYE